ELRKFCPERPQSDSDVLSHVFPNLHYIYLFRENKIRQAVSYVRALVSDSWHMETSTERHEPTDNDSHYNYELILSFYRQLKNEEQAWEKFFLSGSLQPHRVCYESFANCVEGEVRAILQYLGTVRWVSLT